MQDVARSDESATWPAAILTSAFSPDFDPHTLTMAICVGYFEPDVAEPQTITVSGLVSSKARWRQFEDEWTRTLRHHGLGSFSGRDLMRRARAFADGWSDPLRRKALLDSLTRVADRHTLQAFCCSMALADYELVNADYAFREVVAGPYGVCAGALVGFIRRWMYAHHPDNLTLFVFEDGDIDHREVARVTRCDRGGASGEPPQFWPRAWMDERGRMRHLRVMEAGDLLTVDAGQVLVRRMTERARLEHFVVGRDRLVDWCAALDVPRRRRAHTTRIVEAVGASHA